MVFKAYPITMWCVIQFAVCPSQCRMM